MLAQSRSRCGARWGGLCLVLAFFLSACSQDNGGHDHDHFHPEPQHGGEMLELGDHVAHVEFVHDAKNGIAHFYIVDGKGKATAVDQMQLKLQTDSGPKQLIAEQVAGEESHYQVKDAALQGQEPTGRLQVTYKGQTYDNDVDHKHEH